MVPRKGAFLLETPRWLLARQGVGLGLGLSGALVVAAWLGPADYGRWSTVQGPALWLAGLAAWGAPVWALARDERDAFGFTLGTAALLGAIALLLPPLAMGALAAASLTVIGGVPAARLERQGRWRALAAIEVAAQAVQVGLAATLAIFGFGVGAPVAGALCGAAALLVGLAAVGAIPSPTFGATRTIAAHGLGLTGAMQIWTLRELVPAAVIAPLAGPEAVAAVAIGRRLVEAAGFAKGALWRVSVARSASRTPVGAGFQPGRLEVGSEDPEGASARWAVWGPLLAVSLAAPLLAVAPGWEATAALVPVLALATAVNVAWLPRCAALVASGRHRELAAFHLAHVVLLAGFAAWAAPRWGPLAWGIGEIGAFAAYPLLLRRSAAP